MSLSDMKERRLTELHDRWLLVFKQFPIVCHCAARQHGPVTIYEHTEGLDGARSAIGEIEFDVYCPKTHYRASPMPSNVVFASQERELAFGQSLYRAFWGASALRSLTMQDRVPSLIHFAD